jgi:hypothetical protein
MTAVPRLSLPVAVIMGRKLVTGRGWQVPSWRVVGVVAGADLPGRESRGIPVHGDAEEEQFLWGGLRLELFRDAAESYWSNLTGTQPSLFVLCCENEAGALVPKLVTADHDEAGSGVEVGDRVFAAPIPPEVYQHLEAFVIAHHVPQEKRKRKRADWSAAGESGES